MKTPSRKISLGFTSQEFEPGAHICQIFDDDEERLDSLLKFLLSGLKTGEKTACFSEKVDDKTLAGFLEKYGISYEKASSQGDVALSPTKEVYFNKGEFDPDRMIDLLTDYHNQSLEEGYPAARVIGEMSPEVQHIKGGSRLMEYESKVNMLVKKHPVTAVCQYDAHEFSGDIILDILKVHPLMVIKGAVLHNPFYIPPEEFLAKEK